MFGRNDNQQQDNQNNQDSNAIADASIDAAMQAVPADQGQPAAMPLNPPTNDQPAPTADDQWQHPGLPTDTPQETFVAQAGVPGPISDIVAPPAGTEPNPYRPPAFAQPSSDASTPTDTNATPGSLADIKQQALTQLTPLVDHLEQSPEEEFHTTMMMIRASDDQSLLQKAYDAAQRIADEKIKAQALLDVVNEINYFTHQSGN